MIFFLLATGIMTEPINKVTGQTATARPGFDRPTGPPHQARSVVVAKHGIVATSHPLAAEAGLDILKAGGNAADAAIAANAMLGVVEPMSCGIGGDMFVIYWDNATGKLHGLNASGRSPLKISRELFSEQGMQQIPVEGPLSWSVPGCVSGWGELHGRFGSRPLHEILAASIQTADEGFPVTEVIASYWKGAEESLGRWPDSASTFLVDQERTPRFGEIFRNPRLARSYQLIAEQGPDAFYRGSIAKRIVAFSEQNGGLFSMKDFRSHQAEWVTPVSTSYRGYDVWELPPNGQGIAALQILNVLENHDVASMGHGSADFIHLFTEAKKLAFADRARYYADPAFGDLPTEALISRQYGIEQNKRINMQRAAEDVPAGDPRLQQGDTVYLTVIDKDRNCCSFIQSNYFGFGSKVTPADVGFAMQNRGALFALDDEHLNRLEPGKRPFHTIIPAMVTHDGNPFFCFGVMGGDMQPQGHVQVLVNLVDFEMNVQAAGDAARVRHVGSATPTGLEAKGVGVINVESGIREAVIEELISRGHQVQRSEGGFGGYQGILIDPVNGVLHGGTESRKDGAAAGY
ncbi:MAG: gamma-glutamyltransferase [Planctomycetaceae bacterium]|nr:gamma-glutamyltransferase [Planctomycetaceae bacterium]